MKETPTQSQNAGKLCMQNVELYLTFECLFEKKKLASIFLKISFIVHRRISSSSRDINVLQSQHVFNRYNNNRLCAADAAAAC